MPRLNISSASSLGSPLKLSKMVSSDELGSALHEAAMHGDRKKLKKILKTGINVDYPNMTGQTALFCACFEGHESAVELLLLHGANPNERTNEGTTPAHVAAYCGNPKILEMIIDSGADLRLHDAKGRTVKDWGLCQSDARRRRKVNEFIEKTRHMALADALGRVSSDGLGNTSSSPFVINPRHESLRRRQQVHGERSSRSLGNLLGLKNSKHICSSPSVQNRGFGKLYFGTGEHVGTMASIPLVRGTSLKHDGYGCTYNNGPFMVMESMYWHKTMVTVKRLHKEPVEGGQVDLLIQENDYMARLRHPNILLLMGVCQTNNLDDLILIYERVGCGSLFTHIYQRVETLDTLTMCEVLRQIGDALEFLHQHNLVHCYITSHAIQMVLPNYAKLCNFEYMTEMRCSADGQLSKCGVLDNKYLNAAYNWVAPEVLAGEPPNEKSDLYSLCAVLWELLSGTVPWNGYRAAEIKTEVVDNRNMLEISAVIKRPFQILLQYGLTVEPKGRHLTVEQFRDILAQVVVDYKSMGIHGDSPHPARNATLTSSQPSRTSERYPPPTSSYQSPASRDEVDGEESEEEQDEGSPREALIKPEASLMSDQYSNEMSDVGEGSETLVKSHEDLDSPCPTPPLSTPAPGDDILQARCPSDRLQVPHDVSLPLDDMREVHFTAGLSTTANASSTPQIDRISARHCKFTHSVNVSEDTSVSEELTRDGKAADVECHMVEVESQQTAVYQHKEMSHQSPSPDTPIINTDSPQDQSHNLSTTSRDSQYEFINNPTKRAFFEGSPIPSPCKNSNVSSDMSTQTSLKEMLDKKDRACGTDDLPVTLNQDNLPLTRTPSPQPLSQPSSAAQSDTGTSSHTSLSPPNPFKARLKQETEEALSAFLCQPLQPSMARLNSNSSIPRSPSGQSKATVYGALSRQFPQFTGTLPARSSNPILGRNVARIGASFSDLNQCFPQAIIKHKSTYSTHKYSGSSISQGTWSSSSAGTEAEKAIAMGYKPASHHMGDATSPKQIPPAPPNLSCYKRPHKPCVSQRDDSSRWTRQQQEVCGVDTVDSRFSSPCAQQNPSAGLLPKPIHKSVAANQSDTPPVLPRVSPPRTSPREEKNGWCQGKGIKALITGFQGQLEEHVRKQAVLVKNRKSSKSDELSTCLDQDASSIREADQWAEPDGSVIQGTTLYHERAADLLAGAKPSSASLAASSSLITKTR